MNTSRKRNLLTTSLVRNTLLQLKRLRKLFDRKPHVLTVFMRDVLLNTERCAHGISAARTQKYYVIFQMSALTLIHQGEDLGTETKSNLRQNLRIRVTKGTRM